MLLELNTHFDESEKDLLAWYVDFDIKSTVQTDDLFFDNGENVTNPRRFIDLEDGDGYYLMEIETELNEWYMGMRDKNFKYAFWGPYRDLETALKSL